MSAPWRLNVFERGTAHLPRPASGDIATLMRILWAVVLAVLVAGCLAKHERPTVSGPPAEEVSLGDIRKFFAAVGEAKAVAVYEGLPRATGAGARYEQEAKRPDLIHFEGYLFYAQPLAVPPAEKRKLTDIVMRPDAHQPFGGYKLCGGYHPDYAIVWTVEGETSGTLICFGCHEWKNFTPQGRLYEDISPVAYKELHAILAKYRVNRPKVDQ